MVLRRLMRCAPAVLLLGGTLAALCCGAPDLADGALALLPAIALVCALSLGWHPGERTLERLARRAGRRPRPARAARRLASTACRPPFRARSGGLLVACSAARRGPPAVA